MELIFVIICFFLALNTSGEYITEKIIIDRPVQSGLSYGAMVDGFRKLGSGSLSLQCSEFNAERPYGDHSANRCECDREEATFSFFNRKWLCVDNEDFRERKGMYIRKA